MAIRKEIEQIKREDRSENVARIAKANAHQQHKILLRIE
jgi:hypothetical protein